MKALAPTRSILVLMMIGWTDLVATAVLHAQGKIVELNPAMRIFIEHSEWLFSFVKALTLVCAWVALAWYAKKDLRFIRMCCWSGSAAYVALWSVWFFAAI